MRCYVGADGHHVVLCGIMFAFALLTSSFFVISTVFHFLSSRLSVSAWRDLKRCLDYARHDIGGGLIVSSIVMVAQVVHIDNVAGGLLYYVTQSFLLAGSIFGLDQYLRIIKKHYHEKPNE